MTIEWETLHLEYDPFKAKIGGWIRHGKFIRRLFYRMLGWMFLREKYVKRELRQFASNREPIWDILDAGSGYGQYSWYCAKVFPEANILGVDVKEDQVEDCALFFKKMQKSRCRFEVKDLEELSYDSQFDLVLCVDVMEHVVDDVAVFRNFHQSLRPGGLCLINTPTRDPELPATQDSNHVDSVIAEHVREGYTSDEIRQKLSEAGFEVKKVIYTYGKHGAKAWRLLQGHPMRWIHARKWIAVLLPIYYLFVYPIASYWMRRDLHADNMWGGGILVVARKP